MTTMHPDIVSKPQLPAHHNRGQARCNFAHTTAMASAKSWLSNPVVFSEAKPPLSDIRMIDLKLTTEACTINLSQRILSPSSTGVGQFWFD
jgi:hypothetical protein